MAVNRFRLPPLSEQVIDVGPMSGKSNILFWLERRGIVPSDGVVERIYERAKSSNHTLSEAEIMADATRAMTKLALIEISPVTLGASINTRTLAAKGGGPPLSPAEQAQVRALHDRLMALGDEADADDARDVFAELARVADERVQRPLRLDAAVEIEPQRLRIAGIGGDADLVQEELRVGSAGAVANVSVRESGQAAIRIQAAGRSPPGLPREDRIHRSGSCRSLSER